MEEEIQDKLEEKYTRIRFKITMLELNRKYIIYKLESSIKITDFSKGIMSIGFTFNFRYERELTLDANLNDIMYKIDKHIIKLFKEE